MKVLLPALFILIFSYCAFSQVTSYPLNQKTVVKDTAGNVYPYVTWVALMEKGHELRPITPGDRSTEFILHLLSDQQLQEKLEKTPRPRESDYFKTGEKTALFQASDLEGKSLNPGDSTGKIIVLNFWFINCGPCRKEIPALNELVDSFAKTNKVLFYGVALDQKPDLEKFLAKMPFHYTIIENGRAIASQYGIRSYPTHAIIDQEGKVYFHTVGLASNTVYWLRKSISELLARK